MSQLFLRRFCYPNSFLKHTKLSAFILIQKFYKSYTNKIFKNHNYKLLEQCIVCSQKLFLLIQELDYELRRQSGEGNAYVGLRLAKSTTSQEDVNMESSPRKPTEETNISDLLALQVNYIYFLSPLQVIKNLVAQPLAAGFIYLAGLLLRKYLQRFHGHFLQLSCI